MTAIKKIIIASGIFFSLYALPGCGESYVTTTTTVAYENPVWAPPYYRGVRYYYLPDVEMYYDLSNRNFVYFNNGDWMYSPMMPSMYSSYDLNNGYVVALDVNVYRPWMHHSVYATHYPKYYYRNVYESRGVANVRGFNENERQPFYWKETDQQHRTSVPVQSQTQRTTQPTQRTTEVQRNQTQQPANHDKNTGQPVKVTSDMRERRVKPQQQNNNNKDNKNNNKGKHNNQSRDNKQ